MVHTAPNSAALPKRRAGMVALRRCANSSTGAPALAAAAARVLVRRSVSKAPGSRLLMVTLAPALSPEWRDAAVAPLDHAVHGGLDQLDGCEHVGVDRCDPGVAVPLAEVAGRRATGVVDQNVDLRAGGQGGGPPCRRGDVTRHGAHLDAGGGQAQGSRGSLERVGATRGDHHVDAFGREGLRAAQPESLAGGADQRPFALDAQIHDVVL
ncbi:MAG: hypothetical protein RL375_4461 [Pseudomonadota bacterium]